MTRNVDISFGCFGMASPHSEATSIAHQVRPPQAVGGATSPAALPPVSAPPEPAAHFIPRERVSLRHAARKAPRGAACGEALVGLLWADRAEELSVPCAVGTVTITDDRSGLAFGAAPVATSARRTPPRLSFTTASPGSLPDAGNSAAGAQ